MFDHLGREILSFLLQATPFLAQVINKLAEPFQGKLIHGIAKHIGIDPTDVDTVETVLATNTKFAQSLQHIEEKLISSTIQELGALLKIKLD